ncbi:MAG: ATP-dependent helicase, partial [Chitinophagales bacterium]
IGYPHHFTIYDTDDAKAVIKTVVNELNLDDKHYKANIVYGRISQAKNGLISPAEYATDYYIQQEDTRSNRPAIAQIYDAYAKRCFKNGSMDFDDLLLKFYELLKHFPESLHKYQHKFKYILIDEFQDTNPAQYEIIKLLGAVYENVCVVGDDAQSIYSFRGATIENILQFQKDYDDVKVVKLEQNYRSTQSIITVANEVIRRNKGQIPKNLWTENAVGEKIKLVRTMTDNDEGKYVADTIQEQKLRNHFNNRDFAILYRTNSQSRAFEESLRRMGIPYTIYGGISFYQRKEIKDFISYLRVIVNPVDEESLKRIINYPTRGIGKSSIDKAVLLANEKNISMWEALTQASSLGYKGATLEAVEQFVQMIKSFSSMLAGRNAYEVAIHVGKQTNIVKDLFTDKTTEGLARYENIQELLNSIKEWVDNQHNLAQIDEDGIIVDPTQQDNARGQADLSTYLQQITLLTDADQKDPHADTVKLMTIHAAKGLEFSCVFAAGLEESLFPNAMSINTREELEEERRLFYVVITRAKHKLWISYANSRYRFGSVIQNDPSRFIEEIPEDQLDRSYAGGSVKNQSGWGNRPAFDRLNRGYGSGEQGGNSTKATKPSYLPVNSKTPVQQHIPSLDFAPSDTSNLSAGDKVEHQKFGFGEVIRMEGSAHNPVATVNFALGGEKKIMLNYAKLRIIGGI